MTINAIQAARQGLLAPIQYLELDLSSARQAMPLGITANTFYIDPGADGSAYRGALVDLIIDKTPLTAGPGFLLRQQSADVAVTNAAQPGKRLRLVYGQDVSITSWFNQSAVSLQSQQALVPESQNYYEGSSASSSGNQTIITLNGGAVIITGGTIYSGAHGNSSVNQGNPDLDWALDFSNKWFVGTAAQFGVQPLPAGTVQKFGVIETTHVQWRALFDNTGAAITGDKWKLRTLFLTQIVYPMVFRGNKSIIYAPGLSLIAGTTASVTVNTQMNYSFV